MRRLIPHLSPKIQQRPSYRNIVNRNRLDLLPEIVEKLDEPMGDNSLIPTFLLCRETRKYVTVALGGERRR